MLSRDEALGAAMVDAGRRLRAAELEVDKLQAERVSGGGGWGGRRHTGPRGVELATDAWSGVARVGRGDASAARHESGREAVVCALSLQA